MGRGKKLGTEEINKIITYKDCGLSNRAIAKKINRSPKAINNYLKLKGNYGENYKNSDKGKIKIRDKRAIIRCAVQKKNVCFENSG